MSDSEFDDKELEKLALTYSKEQGDDCLTGRTQPGTPVGECITLFCGCNLHDAFKAGYQVAEAKALERIEQLRAALDNLQIVCCRIGADYPIEQLIELRIETERARQALEDDGNE